MNRVFRGIYGSYCENWSDCEFYSAIFQHPPYHTYGEAQIFRRYKPRLGDRRVGLYPSYVTSGSYFPRFRVSGVWRDESNLFYGGNVCYG